MGSVACKMLPKSHIAYTWLALMVAKISLVSRKMPITGWLPWLRRLPI